MRVHSRCLLLALAVSLTVFETAWAAFPTGRFGHSISLDTSRHRLVLFGGFDGVYRNDVWVATLGANPAWTQLAPSGTPPGGREYHVALYDPARDRVVVFAGFDGSNLLGDAWALQFSGSSASWVPLAPSGTPPTARYRHAGVFDAPRDRLVVFGGFDGVNRNDVWALRFSPLSWITIAPTGTLPTPRAGHSMIYDSSRQRAVAFAGFDFFSANDVWTLSLAGTPGWNEIPAEGVLPSARDGHVSIYDAPRDRMVMFGGYDDIQRNDLWALQFPSNVWSTLIPAGNMPSPRDGHAAVFDSQDGRMLVMGGYDGTGISDIWALDPAPPPDWTLLLSSDNSVSVDDGQGTGPSFAPVSPNPSRGTASFRLALPSSARVTLELFDVNGRRVRTVIDDRFEAGPVSASWDGRTESGEEAPAGLFFAVLHVDGRRFSRTLVRLR